MKQDIIGNCLDCQMILSLGWSLIKTEKLNSQYCLSFQRPTNRFHALTPFFVFGRRHFSVLPHINILWKLFYSPRCLFASHACCPHKTGFLHFLSHFFFFYPTAVCSKPLLPSLQIPQIIAPFYYITRIGIAAYRIPQLLFISLPLIPLFLPDSILHDRKKKTNHPTWEPHVGENFGRRLFDRPRPVPPHCQREPYHEKITTGECQNIQRSQGDRPRMRLRVRKLHHRWSIW